MYLFVSLYNINIYIFAHLSQDLHENIGRSLLTYFLILESNCLGAGWTWKRCRGATAAKVHVTQSCHLNNVRLWCKKLSRHTLGHEIFVPLLIKGEMKTRPVIKQKPERESYVFLLSFASFVIVVNFSRESYILQKEEEDKLLFYVILVCLADDTGVGCKKPHNKTTHHILRMLI